MCLSVLVHKLAYKQKNHYKAVFLFLHYTLRMRMVINGSMQNVSRSGEKGGPFALANGGK